MRELSMEEIFDKPGRGEVSLARWMVRCTDRFQKLAESLGVRPVDCRETNFYNGGDAHSAALVYSKEPPSSEVAGPLLTWKIPSSLDGGVDNGHIELGFGFAPFSAMTEPGKYDNFGRRPLRYRDPWEYRSADSPPENVRVLFWPEGTAEDEFASLDWDYAENSEICRFVRSCSDIFDIEYLKSADSTDTEIGTIPAEAGWTLAERLIRLYVRNAQGLPLVPEAPRKKAIRRK